MQDRRQNSGVVTAKLVWHCILALVGTAAAFSVALYLLASWSSGDFWPFDNGAQIPWETLVRLAIPATALVAAILGAVIAGHGQATRLEELRNSRDANVTERYAKAIEQLGSKHAAIRLGGIFALERIGHDSERDRTTVVNVLSSSLFKELPASSSKAGAPVLMPPAEEAALMVALMRLRKPGETSKLESYLVGKANLENADLRGAYLHDTNMTRYLLFNANLSGANLSKAVLRRAILLGANFSGANLSGADLTEAELLDSNFENADLSAANLKNADLENASFKGANLKDAQVDRKWVTNASFSFRQRQVMKIVENDPQPASLQAATDPFPGS